MVYFIDDAVLSIGIKSESDLKSIFILPFHVYFKFELKLSFVNFLKSFFEKICSF